ncbi:PHB depolymerase family esterase [Alteromonas facilis]|uniref:extracellular catalytic domain type 2 short-chain-length polyhydroxyalkanoate depolymerase n=1 Tax=Alteromonas facilis TaxID=2048004 RepID=UPI000C2898A5
MKTTRLHAIVLGLLSSPVALADTPLPSLSLDKAQTTVSGLSSGGYMATQFHLAHSDWVSGAALIGTGPYYCAKGDIGVALSQCVSKMETPINADALLNQAAQYQAQNKIPPLENLADDRVWILHGKLDKTVNRTAAETLVNQYTQWVTEGAVEFVGDKPFSHHFPTTSTGTACEESASPFIGNCDYDAAGELLQFLYGELQPKSEEPMGKLYSFNQQQLGGENAEGLGETGYLYVPESCTSEGCRLHISFHGCNQNAQAVGDAYASQTGLNAWADSNNIVVLYPQTKTSMFMPLNPQACWDWWGYSGEDYATADGVQIKAVEHMVEQLLSNAMN